MQIKKQLCKNVQCQNVGVSISKFLLGGRVAANKISNNFDRGSVPPAAAAATPHITPNVTPTHP